MERRGGGGIGKVRLCKEKNRRVERERGRVGAEGTRRVKRRKEEEANYRYSVFKQGCPLESSR